MVARAGIKTVAADAGHATTSLRMPGVVQPNAYKEVAVTSLVSGRVMQVRAELGSASGTGRRWPPSTVPELADAQTAFIVARADQVAHAQRQTRTQRLTAIGAASREELEDARGRARDARRGGRETHGRGWSCSAFPRSARSAWPARRTSSRRSTCGRRLPASSRGAPRTPG